MSNDDTKLALLRVQLFTAAQTLKGDALDDLKQLVRGIAGVLDVGEAKFHGLSSRRRNIAEGDVVRRANSPQLMTVAEVHESDGRPFAASCVWFVELDVGEWSGPKRKLFDVDDLERIELQSACHGPGGMPSTAG